MSNSASLFQADAAMAWRGWVVANQDKLFLSVVTLMEVRFGVEKCHAKGATQKAAALRKWLTAAETAYRGRIVPVSSEIAHKAGELLWSAVASGAAPRMRWSRRPPKSMVLW